MKTVLKYKSFLLIGILIGILISSTFWIYKSHITAKRWYGDRYPDIIDLSRYMAVDANLSKAKLLIPYYHYSTYIQRKNYLHIKLGFENYEIPYQESKPFSGDGLKVHYKVTDGKKGLFSFYYKEKVISDKMEKIDFIEGFSVYLVRFGEVSKGLTSVTTYFIKDDSLGRPIAIKHLGNTKDPLARPLIINYYSARYFRYLGDGIELDYWAHGGKINIHDWSLVDKKMIQKINSFQKAYRNYELIKERKSNKNKEVSTNPPSD